MSTPVTRPIALVCTLALVSAACSNTGSSSSSRSPAATANLGSACKRKLLTPDDIAGILHAPSTAEEVAGDNGSTCQFTTAEFASVAVTLRPGMGETTLAIWKSGKMPVSGVAEPGVGDEAIWVDGTHEVVARKDDLLCDIQVSGLDGRRAGTSVADQRRGAGALCNRIFAATR